MPLAQTPAWIIQGINLLSFIYNRIQAEIQKEQSHNVLKNRIYE